MAIFPWEQRQIVIILCNAHIVRVYLHLVNYEFTVAINTYITHRDRCKYGVAEGPCTENEIFLLVIYNLFETISLYGPQFTHLCGSQNKPLHRQSWVWIPGMCSGGCVTSGKLPNSASLSFSLRPMGNNAFLMGCYAWHTGTLLQMREWPGNCTFHLNGRDERWVPFYCAIEVCRVTHTQMLIISNKAHCSLDMHLPRKGLMSAAASSNSLL